MLIYIKEYGKRGFIFIGGTLFVFGLVFDNGDALSLSVVFVLLSVWMFKL